RKRPGGCGRAAGRQTGGSGLRRDAPDLGGIAADRAVLNAAPMGWFSADRTIRGYAAEVWGITPEA
ncbi:MAG: hypothetical protein AAFV96_17830, partial [Pseudomonadota bacterium]